MSAVTTLVSVLLYPFHHFRYFIAAFGIVFFWRGVWLLCDLFLFPIHPVTDQELKSAVSSLVIGVVLLYIDDFRLDELRMTTHPLKMRRRKRLIRNSK